MRQHGSRYLLIAILLHAFGSIAAQDLLTPEQLIDRFEFGELQWSADGQRLAMVVTEPVLESGQPKNIWMYEVDEVQIRQLTWSGDSFHRPQWSPDGNTIAFVSADPDPEQTEEESKSKDDEIVVSETIRPVRLRVIDIATGETNSLTDGKW